MDKDQLYEILTAPSVAATSKNTLTEIDSLAAAHPYAACLQFTRFRQKAKPDQSTIAQLACFKGDPYLFASFITQVQQQNSLIEEKVQEDVLSLINELPNSSIIEITKESKTYSNTEAVIKDKPASSIFSTNAADEQDPDKSLMVMMSFTDWLFHFKNKTEREKREEKDKKALKTAWQKEKLAAATEEENEEIPEEIFKQAMDSISENSIISESLALILAKQGKTDKAVDMYKKLSLRNPEKNLYFADRIKELTTIKDY